MSYCYTRIEVLLFYDRWDGGSFVHVWISLGGLVLDVNVFDVNIKCENSTFRTLRHNTFLILTNLITVSLIL